MLKKKAKFDYFHSNEVTWRQGLFRLQRATWHSCQMWGWTSLRNGEHAIEYYDYFVFTIRIGTRGWAWYYYPYQLVKERDGSM